MFRFGYLTNLTNFSSPFFRSSGSNMSPSGGSSAQFAVGDLVQVPSINDVTFFSQHFDPSLASPHCYFRLFLITKESNVTFQSFKEPKTKIIFEIL